MVKPALGIDIGSVAVKAVLMKGRDILARKYLRMHASPEVSFFRILSWAEGETGIIPATWTITGRGAAVLSARLGVEPVNELFAQAAGARYLCPEAGAVIDIGGHDAAYILLDRSKKSTGSIRDFNLNSRCAAGTGSFLDQQAVRLGVNIEDSFQDMALSAENVPRIAGRCSVFAKSDMIHLQQVATPDSEILAGLCRAMASSYRNDIIRNLAIEPPVVFVGGVSSNRAMTAHLRHVLGLDEAGLVVPADGPFSGAVGAVLRSREDASLMDYPGAAALKDILARRETASVVPESRNELRPLPPSDDAYLYAGPVPESFSGGVYLGIDVGSISTNLVLTDREGRVVAKQYLMTAGRPIEAVRKGLEAFHRQFGQDVEILGCGTTGSGRYLIGDLFGADLVKNEITAQAKGAVHMVPDADTVFEIGGQDSKYISIESGMVRDFTMNKACAAGTGSFLEEQAGLMGISVKDYFARLAFASGAPSPLGQRCTVFIESDLVRRLGEGESRENLCAGLAYSIVNNYINRVVEHRPVGKKILFQGGTAFNRAVTAAFRQVTGADVLVPPHNEVTGALGMAVLVGEAHRESGFATRFAGFDTSTLSYRVRSFTCRECANQCEIRMITRDGADEPLYYGHRCEKYDRVVRSEGERLDFSHERKRIFDAHIAYGPRDGGAGTIGIPMGLSFHETLPFWSAFWADLGYRVLVSPETGRALVNAGVSRTHADACFPMKVFHGHVDALLSAGADHCFIPAFVNMPLEGSDSEHNFICPISQSAPFIARAAFRDRNPKILSPTIHMQYGTASVLRELRPMAKELGIPAGRLEHALSRGREAQRVYERALKDAARVFLIRHRRDRKILLVGRPYNLSDSGLNLDIPRKLSDLGIPSLPLDVLALLRPDDNHGRWRDLYWRYGQQIMRLLEETADDPDMLPVYITNFNCGPDSFLLHYAARTRRDRPILFLELDEHSADAGIITRLEAFLDSIPGGLRTPVSRPRKSAGKSSGGLSSKKVFVPNMCDDAIAVAAGFRSEGIDAVVLDEPDTVNVELGRKHTSGKECFPMILTTGDLFKITSRADHVPGRSVFFMPTTNGPCRFGEYSRLQEMILEENGLAGIEIFSPSSGDGYDALRELSGRFYYNIWKGMACIDILFKTKLMVRPVENTPGQTDAVYADCLKRVERRIEEGGRGLLSLMKECARAFAAISTDERRPVRIGMVGEIYVRSNRFANSDIIRGLESLGAEVTPAPFGEWSFYSNFLSRKNNLDQGRFLSALSDTFKNILQHRIEQRFAGPFSSMGYYREPHIGEVMRKAGAYLDPGIRGEAVLSIGKAVDFADRGFSGVVNVMPFSCMPGLIVSSISPSIRADRDGIPWLDISFEDSEQTIDRTELEAFVSQARSFCRERGYCRD